MKINNIANVDTNKQNRIWCCNKNERLVSKCGLENVVSIANVPCERIRKMGDTFHTLINLRWRYLIFGTMLVHLTIWFVFAVFWYLTAIAHGDFDQDPPKHLCVTGGKDFINIFLASIEAQTTIGFGDRAIDEECPESIFLLIMQLVLGTGMSGILASVVYSKLTRPEKMSKHGVGFSKFATLYKRDGCLCFAFRVWDLNGDHNLGTEISVHFIQEKRTVEGEMLSHYVSEMKLEGSAFLIWPLTMVHKIDRESPLYNMTRMDFANQSFEITVTLKGASAVLGTYTHSKTSYLPQEILWGYRFDNVVSFVKRKGKYVIDIDKLERVSQTNHFLL